MKIYVASGGDSLRSIARKMDVDLRALLFLNPQIKNPDNIITGSIVTLPQSSRPTMNGPALPFCPPDIPSQFMPNWIPTTPLEKMAQTDYDVVIIGSGAGGGAILWRLCEQWKKQGKKIGMVETGEAPLPTHIQNIATMNGSRANSYLANPLISKPIGDFLPEFPGALLITLLGGRTMFWGAVCPRMHASDLKDWSISPQEMDSYYNIAEEVMNVTPFYAQSSFTETLLNRMRRNGFPEAERTPVAADMEATSYGQIHSNVIFSSIVFLGRALNELPFDLAVSTKAVQILTEQGGVSGVRVMSKDKQSYVLNAKTVVVSASTLETPRLLLYSGIPGNAIGHYLTNHSSLFAPSIIGRDQFPELMGNLGILVPYSNLRPYQIQIGSNFWSQYEEKPISDKLVVDLLGFGKVEPRYENKVSLDPGRRDDYGVPLIRVHFSYSEKDQFVIRQMANGLIRAAEAMGTQLVTKSGVPDICMRLPGRPFHDTGTCRIGDNPMTSATNRYGQIHGISGLYVADNSVLPSSGGANPTLTTVALAIRTADYIAGQMK